MRPDAKFLLARPAHFLALGFGAGLAPRAPGTFGTLAALPCFALLFWLGGRSLVTAAAVALFLAGCYAAGVAGRALGAADHGSIVIDEIAAFLLVLLATPLAWWWFALAFGLFRLFDIVKPWPIRLADQRIKGGIGVMFDDLLAAGYSIACLWMLRYALEGLPR